MAKIKKYDQYLDDLYDDPDLSRSSRNHLGRIVANHTLDTEEPELTSDAITSNETDNVIAELPVEDATNRHPEDEVNLDVALSEQPTTELKTVNHSSKYALDLIRYRRKTGNDISDNPTPEELIKLIDDDKDPTGLLNEMLGYQLVRYLRTVIMSSAKVNEMLRSSSTSIDIDDLISEAVLWALQQRETSYKGKNKEKYRYLPYVARYAVNFVVKKIIESGSSMLTTPGKRSFDQKTATIAKSMVYGHTLSLDTVPFDTGSHEQGTNPFEYGSYEKRGGHNARRIVGVNREDAVNINIQPNKGDDIDTLVDEIDTEALVSDLLKTVDAREFEIISERFGFGDDEPKKLQEVGASQGLSRARISQIEAKVLADLRYNNMIRDFAFGQRRRMASRRPYFLQKKYEPMKYVPRNITEAGNIFAELVHLTDCEEGNYEKYKGEVRGMLDRFIQMCLGTVWESRLEKLLQNVPHYEIPVSKLQTDSKPIQLLPRDIERLREIFMQEAHAQPHIAQERLVKQLLIIQQYAEVQKETVGHISTRDLTLALEISLRRFHL